MHGLKAQWNRRSKFAEYSAQGLAEIAETFTKLDSFLNLFQVDLNFLQSNSLPAIYKRYTHGLTAADLKALQQIQQQLQICTRAVCAALAEAMLERLMLIPDGYLADMNLMGSSQFNDDVVFDILQSLVNLNLLDPLHAKNFLTQSPAHRTLTAAIVRNFNQFISLFGSDETNQKLGTLFAKSKQKSNGVNSASQNDSEPDEFILIPLHIPGHYELKTDQNCLSGFIYIDSIQKSEPEPKKTVNLVESFVNLSKSEAVKSQSLEFSIYDMGENRRIVIPIFDYVKIPIRDEKIKKLYGIVLDDEKLEVREQELADFCYMQVLDSAQEAMLKDYATRFSDSQVACFFIETATDLYRNAEVKDINSICATAFKMVTDECIRIRLNLMQTRVTPDNLITESQRLALMQSLRDNFSATWNVANGTQFENKVLCAATDMLEEIYRHQKSLQQRMVRMPAAKSKFVAEKFIENSLSLLGFPTYYSVQKAVSTAELDLFINDQNYTDTERNSLKDEIQRQPHWETNKNIWVTTEIAYKQFCNFKLQVIQDLIEEKKRLQDSKTLLHSASKTNNKVKLLKLAIVQLLEVSTRREMQEILLRLQQNQLYTQARRSGFWKILATSTSESERNMAKILGNQGFKNPGQS